MHEAKKHLFDLLSEVELYFRETKIEKPGWKRVHERLIYLWCTKLIRSTLDVSEAQLEEDAAATIIIPNSTDTYRSNLTEENEEIDSLLRELESFYQEGINEYTSYVNKAASDEVNSILDQFDHHKLQDIEAAINSFEELLLNKGPSQFEFLKTEYDILA